MAVRRRIVRTPSARTVKIIERGNGAVVVFLHSGVGSAGEWRQVFSLWPEGYRLIAVDAYRDADGPGAGPGAEDPRRLRRPGPCRREPRP